MTESIPPILKKEYGCHRQHIARTEECFAKQLESSVTTEHILKDLNNLEENVSFKVYLGILISFFAAFALWLTDVVSDGHLTKHYYQDFTGFNRNLSVLECNIPRHSTTNVLIRNESTCDDLGIFNELQTNSHKSLDAQQRFYWTLLFVILPFVLNCQEYLTLKNEYEITKTRKRFSDSFHELRENKCNLKTFPILLKTLAYLVVCLIVIVLWTPITALYQWVWSSKYEIAFGRKKVEARKGKRRCDLTASRGELCEVNVESAFEPVVQGYIIFPYIVMLSRKIAKMIDLNGGSIVFNAQCFTTMELSQLFAIISSIASLAWSYSEYHSVKKNDLLFITESPFTRILMVVYMLLQIMSRLLSFQVFAYFWAPGNLYPIILFILGHMLVCGVLHIIFSEDLYYFRKKEYGKFFHNVLMNSLANIYFHNYLRMDERPEIEKRRGDVENLLGLTTQSQDEDEENKNLLSNSAVKNENEDKKKSENEDEETRVGRGIHISTFFRQLTFDILFLIEMIILVRVGFHGKGFLSSCSNFKEGKEGKAIIEQIVHISMFVSIILRLFYYCGLHIWSNDIMWSRVKREKQDEIRIFGFRFFNCIEYAWEFNNTWILGEMKRSIKITLLIIPQSWIEQIKTQITEMQEKTEEGINFASVSSLKRSLRNSARNILNFRKTVAMLCFLPLLLLGLLVPFLIIIILVLLIILMIPFMVLLFVYNLFARNITAKKKVDFGTAVNLIYKNRIEELPLDVFDKDTNIISGKDAVTSTQIKKNLLEKGILDLHGRRKITEDELKNVVFFVLSLNSKKFNKSELNMNDTRLTDSYLEIMVPMASRFKMLKIGGEQQFTEDGLEKFTKHLRKHGNKSKLKRLEMHGTKVENFQVVKKAAEEFDAFEGMTEKIHLINGISDMLPYLQEVSLNGFLKYSTFDTRNYEAENLGLWSCINSSSLTSLSIRDCNITDSILAKGSEGFLKMCTFDLSENPRITAKGWKEMSSNISQATKLQHLVYQQGIISEASAKCIRDLFSCLNNLDLAQCKFEGNSLQILLENMQHIDELSKMKIEKISLKNCSLKKTDQERIEAINNIHGASLIILDVQEKELKRAVWICC
eukprot:GFUD01015205.1.p1 GENE.GFUD01015205.1~~GFUD01015205.1.p1  ORF type:complete len:1185 (+),score=225.12 GFUD01015205.1:258-3557(+)